MRSFGVSTIVAGWISLSLAGGEPMSQVSVEKLLLDYEKASEAASQLPICESKTKVVQNLCDELKRRAREDSDAPAQLAKCLTHRDKVIRQDAAAFLCHARKKAAIAVPQLEKMLLDKNEDPMVRSEASRALGAVGQDANDSFARALKSPDKVSRDYALCGLASSHLTDNRAGIKLILGAIDDEDVDVRMNVHGALRGWGKEALGELLPLLTDPRPLARVTAAGFIVREVDPEHKQALRTLSDSLSHSDMWVRFTATDAFSRAGSPAAAFAVPALVKNLDDSDAHTRSAAIHALHMIGPAGKVAIPKIVTMLKEKQDKDRSHFVRMAAAHALAHFAPDAKEYVPNLIAATTDECTIVQTHAIRALGSMGPAAKAAIPSLEEAIRRDEHPDAFGNDVPEEARQALERIRGK